MNNKKRRHWIHTIRGLVGVLIVIVLLFGLRNWKGATAAAVDELPPTEQPVTGTTKTVVPSGSVSWNEMLAYEAAHKGELQNKDKQVEIPFNKAPEPKELEAPISNELPSLTSQPQSPGAIQSSGTLVANFAALGDDNTMIPPDTMGRSDRTT